MITYPSKSELKTASEVAVYFRNCPDGKQMFLRSFFVAQFAGTSAHMSKTIRGCLSKATRFAKKWQANFPTYDFFLKAE